MGCKEHGWDERRWSTDTEHWTHDNNIVTLHIVKHAHCSERASLTLCSEWQIFLNKSSELLLHQWKFISCDHDCHCGKCLLSCWIGENIWNISAIWEHNIRGERWTMLRWKIKFNNEDSWLLTCFVQAGLDVVDGDFPLCQQGDITLQDKDELFRISVFQDKHQVLKQNGGWEYWFVYSSQK